MCQADNSHEIIQLNSSTNTAEAIRIIRTNLEFLLKDVEEGRVVGCEFWVMGRLERNLVFIRTSTGSF